MSFAAQIKSFFKGSAQTLDQAFFEDLEDLLVEGDFGPSEAVEAVGALKELCKKEKLNDAETVRQRLAVILEGMLPVPVAAASPAPNLVPPAGLAIILLLGVNGVGKTTTAAKLASLYKEQGYKPILAAADTFRAAASEQLQIHGERLGLRVVAHKQGGDPAAVIFDAIDAAGAAGPEKGVIIADTAGRMHTAVSLVEELKKIDRVVETKTRSLAEPTAYSRILVLDSTTGRNALAQAETFSAAVQLNGVILTKADSTARGGAAFSLGKRFHLPILYTCNGEKYGDIKAFDAKQYTREFLGL